MLHPRAAFTLIELLLAIAIAVIILTMAVPSLSGYGREKELLATFERFDELARKAQRNATQQQRAWVLVWADDRILLQPDAPTPEERDAGTDAQGAGGELIFGESQRYTLERPAALKPPKEVPAEFIFWRSGTCEPAVVTFEGPEGSWRAQYNPLTGRGEITDQMLP